MSYRASNFPCTLPSRRTFEKASHTTTVSAAIRDAFSKMTEPPIQQPASAPTSINNGADHTQANQFNPATLTGSDLVKHLEWIVYSFTDAINNRDFSWLENDGPLSKYIAADFTGTQERFPEISQNGLVGREEHAKFMPMIMETFPNYKIRIFDLSTCVDEKQKKAVMFWNAESTGIGDLALPSTCTMELQRFEDGYWKIRKFCGVRGMVDGYPLKSMPLFSSYIMTLYYIRVSFMAS
ncbi:hypothetical protein CERZMDRAFT_86281 [Cercospora zeae-maydis SCOH1-5]|uniref:SnoaL-like domain-containing protein n=1 Tax=Cercospora zeae-maydis SCOH1-5 TaxID=717836 RepID=A0A6A6F9X5_9PEZI|nr:hypothetical protein CERZMDRAFT_86281 [Cercospora zeae-maydis SCOH1-5]